MLSYVLTEMRFTLGAITYKWTGNLGSRKTYHWGGGNKEFKHIAKESVTIQDTLERRGAGFLLLFFWLLVFKPVVIGSGEPTKHILWAKLYTMFYSVEVPAPKEGLLDTSRGVLRACVSLYGCANRNWSDSVKTRQPSLIKASWWH